MQQPATMSYDKKHDVITIDTHKNSWFDRVFGVDEAFEAKLQRKDEEARLAAKQRQEQQQIAARELANAMAPNRGSQAIQQAMMTGMNVLNHLESNEKDISVEAGS